MTIALVFSSAAEAAPYCAPTQGNFAELRNRVLKPRNDHVVVVAHRGCFAAASENTPEAIDACWRQGVEVVENDVRRTSDGHLVIFHDPEISRMTDKWGYVAEMTLAELREAKLKERDGSHEAYRANFLTNLPITTLEEHLAAAKHKVMINFEIKYSGKEEFEEILAESIAIARRLGVLDHVIFKVPDVKHHGRSSAKHILEQVAFPIDAQIMPIIWGSSVPLADRVPFFEPYQPIGFEIAFEQTDYFAAVRAVKGLDARPVMAVAVQPYWSGGLDDRLGMRDPDAAWGRLIDMGADHIMTDRPEALMRYLEQRKMRQGRTCVDNG